MHNTYAVLYTQGPLASTANVSADEGIRRRLLFPQFINTIYDKN
jgi:hypothetical protein